MKFNLKKLVKLNENDVLRFNQNLDELWDTNFGDLAMPYFKPIIIDFQHLDGFGIWDGEFSLEFINGVTRIVISGANDASGGNGKIKAYYNGKGKPVKVKFEGKINKYEKALYRELKLDFLDFDLLSDEGRDLIRENFSGLIK